MLLKFFLYKLFFLIFSLFFYDIYAFGSFIYDRNPSNFNSYKKNIKNFTFSNKNECFLFLKYKKISLLGKENIVIGNNHYIGFFQKNRFKMFYIVKLKDTLYSIAKNSGHHYNELSVFNSIKKPYKIIVGQKIWIGDFLINENKQNCSIINLEKNNLKHHSSCEFVFKTSSSISNFFKKNIESTKICFSCRKESQNNKNFLKIKSVSFSNHWYWPVKNKNIQYFYESELSNKKIEISGLKGQPVFAAASGEVVCVTDLFKKYGRLIIIRHNKNYLSIYAFNNSVLVKQKDKVYAQQKIATMGLSSKKNLARLYFEIRYRGESINPLNILPKINSNI